MATIELNLDEVEAPTEPSVVFTLDGREWVCKNRSAIPAFAVDALLTGGKIRLGDFWRAVLVAEDGDDFVALLERPDSPLDLTRSQRLAETLAEAILNRPTRPSAPSPRGRLTTAATSKAGSSSPGGGRKKRAS